MSITDLAVLNEEAPKPAIPLLCFSASEDHNQKTLYKNALEFPLDCMQLCSQPSPFSEISIEVSLKPLLILMYIISLFTLLYHSRMKAVHHVR